MANVKTIETLDIDYNWKIYLKSGEVIEFVAGAECGASTFYNALRRYLEKGIEPSVAAFFLPRQSNSETGGVNLLVDIKQVSAVTFE